MDWIYTEMNGQRIAFFSIEKDELPTIKRAVKVALTKLKKEFEKLERAQPTSEMLLKKQYVAEEIEQLEIFINK